MLKYAFISGVAETYAEWKRKAFRNVLIIMTQINFVYPTSYVFHPTNIKIETKGEISL